MSKIYAVLAFCLLLIPFNAVEILIGPIANPEPPNPSDVVIPAGTLEPSQPETPTPPQQVSPKGKIPGPGPNPQALDPALIPVIVDKNEPKEANPVPVLMPPQALPPRPEPVAVKPHLPEPVLSCPFQAPQDSGGKEEPQEGAPGAVLDPSLFFNIIDRNEPKEENPVGVDMDPGAFFSPAPPQPAKVKDYLQLREEPTFEQQAPAAVLPPIEKPSGGDRPPAVDPDAYEPDDSSTQFTTLSNMGPTLSTQAHTLHTNTDQDWFRFYAIVGRIYNFYSTGSTDVRAYLYQDNGTTQLVFDDDGGGYPDFSIQFGPSATGWYKLKVDGYGGVTGSYTLNYLYTANPDAYEPDDTAAQFTFLVMQTYNLAQDHTLTYQDQDWYEFYGIAGMTYTFYSTGNIDNYIYLYQENGSTLLAYDDDSGTEYNYYLQYTPTADARYKIKIAGYSSAVGAYVFNYSYLAMADAYEPDNSSTQYTSLTVNPGYASQGHTLHVNTDQDWYRFYAYTGRMYIFYSFYTTDTYAYLYQDDGTTLIASDDDSAGEYWNFSLIFTPTVNGYYKLKVIGYNGMTGYYLFNYGYFANLDGYEPDNSSTQYTSLTVLSSQQSQNHTIHSADDEDWFRFYAYTGRIYTFSSTGNTDTRIFLYQSDGSTLIDWDDDGSCVNNFFLQYAPTANAYYYLKVDGYGDYVGAYEFYYIYSADPDSYEPDNSATQYTTLWVTSTDQIQYHTIDNTADQDWFRFFGATGRIYHFHSIGNTDTRIFLYQDDGVTQIAFDDDSGDVNNFLLEHEFSTDTYYKLRVEGYPGAVGAYVLHYSNRQDPDAYEPDDSSATARSINIYGGYNTVQPHTLHTNTDQDWFRFFGVNTGTYHFWTTGNTDTRGAIYSDAGTTALASNDDNGANLNFDLSYTITDPSAYFKLRVDGSYVGSIGAYTINYTYTAPPDSYESDDFASLAQTLYPYAIEQVQSHTLHNTADEDWFEFYACTGNIYGFYSSTQGNTDTRVWLYEYDGTNLIASDDDGAGYPNFNLDFSPTANGYYKLKVDGHDVSCGFYEIHYYTWANPDSYEPDNSATQYYPVIPQPYDQTQDHTIHDATDVDWFGFYGQAGRVYRFYSTGNTDTRIFLYAADGVTLLDSDDDDGDGNNFLLDFAPTTSDIYLAMVNAFSFHTGAYVFTYSYWVPADAYEPDNSASQFNFIDLSCYGAMLTQNHTLHTYTDQDWFRFHGTAGLIYTISSSGDSDTMVSLYQDDGITLIASDDDSGVAANFLLEFAPASSAYYKFKVTGCNGFLGSYTLNFFYSAPPDAYEPDNSAVQYTTLSVTPLSQSQSHSLHNGSDEDWYRFRAYPGRIYSFHSSGDCDPVAYLYQDDGSTFVAHDDDSYDGHNFQLGLNVATPGWFKLKVVGYAGAVGLYELNYSYGTGADPYEPDNSSSQYNPLLVNPGQQTRYHTLHIGSDQDWFRFQGVPGRTYHFWSGGWTDTRIWLYMDNGTTQLVSDDNNGDGSNFDLQWVFSTSGYYKLKIDSMTGDVGEYEFNYCYTDIALVAPANLQITYSGGAVNLAWDQVYGTTLYKIQASDNPVSGFTQVGTSTTNSWSAPASGNRRFYRVIASN